MRKLKAVLLACFMILTLGITALAGTFGEGKPEEGHSATSETTNAERNSTQAVPILSITSDESEGVLIMKEFPEGSMGPDDFVVLSENDILILDTLGKRIQRFRDGSLSETYKLSDFRDFPYLMEENSGYVYVLGSKQIAEISLITKDYRIYDLPDPEGAYGDLGSFVSDLITWNGQVILISDKFGNYTVDREKGEGISSKEGYYSACSDNGADIKEGMRSWSIRADNTSIDVLCIEKDGDILVQAVDFNYSAKDKEYLTVRRYSISGELLSKTCVDVAERKHVPRRQIKEYDGHIYQMLPMQDSVMLKRVELTNDLKETGSSSYKAIYAAGQTESTDHNTRGANSPQHVTITRSTALSRATSMKNQQWQFKQGHNYWSDYGATAPAYLVDEEYNSYETGIPYCYGGFNGYATVTNEVGTQFKSYSAIVYQTMTNSSVMRNAAGNINDYVLAHTIGVDCSGYVSSAYGFTNKVSSGTFFSNTTYFKNLLFNTSGLLSMDLVVKSGHVMVCWSVSGNNVTVLEYRASVGHVHSNYFSKDYLSSNGYEFRRPMNWCTGAWNEIGDPYGPD